MLKQKETAEREKLQNIKKTGYVSDPQARIGNMESRFKAIRKAFADRYADSIEPHEVKDFLESLNLSDGTMNRYKTTLSSVYEYAIERKKLKINPTSGVKRFTEELGIPRWMQDDEEKQLRNVIQKWIDETPEEHRATRLMFREHLNEITVASQSGMRKGNQYALRWVEDINLTLRLIVLPDTKSGRPHVIPMTDSVYKALLDQKAIQQELASLRGVGYGSERMKLDGRVFTIRENREWFKKAKDEAGIKSLRWHDLSRHTAGSRLAAGGANQKVIQEVLGHSTLAMSARYTHLSPSHVADVMKAALDR
ncbi:tyrosine-type recombinase/integrase [Granulicella cerasi]|uniref:Tyrosine-type recombinase/integrase n=2 Tax=Granulicella cerasi TaxID=741063 RepID=A0ABW1Z584_9BACT